MKRTIDPAQAQPGQPVKRAVWDLPTRLFHWTLVALLGLSWWSGKQERLELHFYFGYAILALLLFRMLWGFFGSSTARFRNFVRGPAAIVTYVRDVPRWRTIGHSPLGAWSVIALLGLVVLQVATGLLNTDDDGLTEGPLAPLVSFDLSDTMHDFHELFFDLLLVFVVLHVAAVLFYRLFLGKALTGPMITGRALVDPDTQPMRPARRWAAVLCLVVAIAITCWIVAGAPPLGG